MTFRNNNFLFKNLTSVINAVSGKSSWFNIGAVQYTVSSRPVQNIKDLIAIRAVQYADGWDVHTSGAIH